MNWMIFRIIYEVIIVNYLLKKHGMKTIQHYNKKYATKNNKSRLNNKKTFQIIHLIDKVCFLFWGDAECLHRSLIGYKLLRRMGVEVELVVGVKKFPFGSHAWIEYDNEIINDLKEIRSSYHEVLRVGGATP